MKFLILVLFLYVFDNSIIGQTHFTFTSNTGSNATVAVQTSINPTINGVTLSSGDEVGAFTPAGLCVGAILWNNANTALTVWGDNDQTGQIDGIQSGQKISFRIWDQSANIEYANVNAAFDANPPFISTGLYSANGLYRLTSLSAAPDIPVTPTLSSPTNNAVDQSISPTLSWNASTGAATYRLQVATDANFSNVLVDDATLTTTSKQVGLLSNSTKYYWKVNATNAGDTSSFSDVWNFTTTSLVNMEWTNERLRDYTLTQNFPNPFNPSTTIRFSLPQDIKVQLNIYNQQGEKVAELMNKDYQAGIHEISWNAQNLSSGVYFIELKTPKFSSIRKLILLK